MTDRATLLIRGQIVVAARLGGLETADALGIAGDRVVATGSWDDVVAAATPGARVVDVRDRAVVPGIHDFHIHLVALARTRRAVLLDGARDLAEVADRLAAAAARAGTKEWVTGRGWNERQLSGDLAPLEAAVGGRPAFLDSHDGHSAWASAAARRIAGLDRDTVDPPGGRIERAADGTPTGVLRETALEIVGAHVPRLHGAALREALAATLAELAGLGVTGASEAGDYTTENGVGGDAELGDSFSSLTELGDLVDGRSRLTLGIPAGAIGAAARRGLRTGAPLPERRTLRFGWAKGYADGALGSGTAALLARPGLGDGTEAGILRLPGDVLDRLLTSARATGIGMAIHAIGDRAVREVLDALARAGPAVGRVPRDRIEHVQLVTVGDAPRFAALGVTASIQPIHAAADRDLVDTSWRGREGDAYAWRRLVDADALLAAGSDAPVEDRSPWLGVFAAVHRRAPTDRREDWRPEQALTAREALAAYTLGPARALGVADEGHLRPGARADVAVLSVGRGVLLSADERLAGVRSELTLVDGREVPRA